MKTTEEPLLNYPAECMARLKSLSERDLWTRILIPLFRARRWEVCTGNEIRGKIDSSVILTHGSGEPEHKCDILLIRNQLGESSFEGIQAKRGSAVTGRTKVQKIRSDAEIALDCHYKGEDGVTHRLNNWYWITTGDVTPDGGRAIIQYLESPQATSTSARVHVWGCMRLLNEIYLNKPALLPELEKLTLQQGLANRAGTVAASWYAFQLFRWHLRHAPVDLIAAKHWLVVAESALANDPRAPLFFHRTLGRCYRMWQDLADGAPDLFTGGTFDPIAQVDDPRVQGLLQAKYPGTMYWLLSDVSFMLSQLDILERKYANAPSGLSTLHICQLLLRAGYPDQATEVAELRARLDRLVSEELAGDGKSIDQECSLCTGAAVSCLAMSGRSADASRAVKWLEGLESSRYAFHPDFYTGAPPTEHALHYAAMVLEGVFAYHFPRSVGAVPMLRAFFTGDGDLETKRRAWMKFRNNDRFDVYQYILPAFLRCLLAGLPADRFDVPLLLHAIAALVEDLRNEERVTSTPLSRSYAARENLGSLSLGFLLDAEPALAVAPQIAATFHHRVVNSALPSPASGKLWDSSVDRSTAFIDAYFLYWETILEVESRGGDVAKLLPQLPM